jgi:uncharacterized membrane-anchored protein YhcB (DUF1043 family)
MARTPGAWRLSRRKNMKLKQILGWSSALCLSAMTAQAQETNQPADFDQRLIQMQERFEQRERELEAHFDKKTAAQDAEIDALKKQIAGTQANPAAIAASTNAVTPEQVKEQVKELSDKLDNVVEAQKKTLPGEFNPAIGLVGDMVFSYRDKGSDKTGSDRPGGFDAWMRALELNAAASVDPFAKAYAVITASADSATGEATFGVEEAALQTTSLPWNLELKAGRFFGEFGRLGYIHDHELPFVNRPLVLDEYIGGESQSDGLQLNWLPPIPHYVSVTAGVGDHFGADSPNPDNPGTYRPLSGLNFWGRLSSYWDVTPDWQLEAGISGLWNPREEDRGGVLLQPNGLGLIPLTLTEKERRLAGADLKLSYVPLQNNQFQSFTWGTEVLYSDNRYLSDLDGIPNNGDEFNENVGSFGLYSYVNYKWSRQWSAGFLFDWLQSAQNHNDETTAYSPFITFALSHWNQLRLQYTHTDHNAVSGLKPDDAVYLQWAWIIGAHSHGWQQR